MARGTVLAQIWAWWKTLATFGIAIVIAFPVFHLSRWFVNDLAVVSLAVRVVAPHGRLASGAPPLVTTMLPVDVLPANGVLCFIPPNTSPASVNKFVAPYMTQAAMEEVSWWTTGWWRTGDDVWWMARLEGDKALELSRMDQRLRPTMTDPMCVPEQHTQFVNVGPDARGILFQALDCRLSPVACP